MSHGEELEHVRYGPEPTALILGDRTGRLEAAAGHAGFRVVDRVGLDHAVDRLDRQAAVQLVALELADDEPASMRALDRMAAAETAGGPRLLVVMSPLLIDAVSARLGQGDASLLVDPSPLDLAAAFGLAARVPGEPALAQPGHEAGSLHLIELSEQVGQLARQLAALAEDRPRYSVSPAPAGSPAAPPMAPAYAAPSTSPSEPSPVATEVTAASLRALIRARRARDQFFRADLFADPAWDILLDLAAAAKEGRPVPVSSLCIAAAVPPTTALRWIRALTDEGMLVRRADPHDGRRVFVELAADVATAVDACVLAMRRIWAG